MSAPEDHSDDELQPAQRDSNTEAGTSWRDRPPVINVHLLPGLVHPHDLAGNWVVVVDVLRASTTLAAAIQAGVAKVVPCLEVAEARQLADQHRASGADVVLGGERGGRPIAGFDLGNSPTEYTASRVAGRTAIFTTTNGTKAMMRCVGAGRVLIGSFANLTAVVSAIEAARPRRTDVLCAGTDGEVSWEDVLFAGALVAELRNVGFSLANDGSVIAETAWRQVNREPLGTNGLAEAFRCGRGGRNLLAIGKGPDLEWAAKLDRFSIVPELDLSDWSIRKSEESTSFPTDG